MWFYQTSATDQITGGQELNSTHYVLFDTNGTTLGIAYASQNGGSQTAVSATTNYALNSWHHAAYTSTSALGTIYLDGGGKNTVVPVGGAGSFPGTTTPVTGGAAQLRFFDGRIAEFAMWTAVLTDAEILALAKGIPPSQIRRNSLVLYWPLWGVSSPEPDLGGNRNGTVTGATLADHAPVGRYAPVMSYTRHKSTFVPAASGLYVPQRTLRGVGI